VTGVRFVPLLALLCTACAAGSPLRGVVVVTLDTTRADRLPPYGYGDAVMPGLERLAREGVVFDRAYTVAPLTLPAHASLFTGLLPPRHGVRENAGGPLGAGFRTLAETFAAAGYRTAAFVGSVVLDANRGLDRGFEVYDSVRGARERPAGAVADAAIRWLDTAAESPFLLWAHFYDPHLPHAAPEPFASRHDPYVAEIASVDSQVARLVAALERHRLLDRVAVVVLADHGESLGERGERDHGVFLYESVLRIPLIVRAPGFAARRVPSPVSVVDVMPTLLDLAGLAGPAGDGVSLADAMGGGAAEREIYAESVYPARFGWAPLFALRDARYKLIDAPQAELYDLRGDPFEERNLAAARPAVASAMRQRLRTLRGGAAAVPMGRVDPALVARLAALGYVGGGGPGPAAPDGHLPDPKACRGTFHGGHCRPDATPSAPSHPRTPARD
jgi:choline-sulfatase